MRFSVLLVTAGLALTACGQSPTATQPAPVEAGAVFPDQYEGPADILTVIDAGYPMYAVTARVDGYTDPIEMLLNDQGTELNGLEPDALAGQTVTLSVITENRPALRSMTLNGVEIFAGEGMAALEGEISMTGVLEGAGAETAGDLPDVVTVAAADGTFTPLEAFITPEMVAANGQQVTAAYVVVPMRSITRVAAVAP